MNTFISVKTFLESTKKNKYIDYSPLIKGVFCFQIEKVDDDLKKYNLFIEDEKTKNKIILKTKLKPNIKYRVGDKFERKLKLFIFWLQEIYIK